MKYSVIKIQGKQQKVKEGDTILVDKLTTKEPEYEVLLTVNETDVKIGNPTVKGAKVDLKVIGDEKGDKIYVSKYKAKSRFRKRTGFRAKYTKLQVEKIS